ncbi:Hsp20/alpha crystallin family protein [candidate division WOR-3 bacterium]|nr:Hsp20/alpha crystallin family protein [candidate division WOR-3 bacterium]
MTRNLRIWDPMREVTSLRDDMDRVFDSMVGRWPRDRMETIWAPAIDIEETRDDIVVRAELPGMKKEDIKVTLSGDTLTITGERKHEAEEKGKTFYRIERAYGKFQRTVVLPSEVDGTKAKASYKAGVLGLAMPKSEREKAREIQIQAED